jgi:hypothetical protein
MREPASAPGNRWKLRTIDCPRCAGPVVLRRNGAAHIDACGFESYRLDCASCDAVLTGVVDPYDDALLVSAARPAIQNCIARRRREVGHVGA